VIVRRHERVLVQGITGRQGSFWAEHMLAYGTRIVGGINPKRAGETCCGVPVLASATAASAELAFDVSVLFIPPLACKAAALDAIEAGCKKLVVLSEHIPLQDTAYVLAAAREAGCRVIGPNTAGLVTPGECFVGFMPAFNPRVFRPGAIGVVSRSGSLGTLVCLELVRAGLGISAFVGIGGDPILGTSMRDALVELDRDLRTAGIALVGEIGGTMEEEAAGYARTMRKPVAAFVAGAASPPGRRMGHAGAIVTGGRGSHAAKQAALEAAGVAVVPTPGTLGEILASLMQ
jgi:succinyl-CoA synthetase alpha subunit